MSVLMSFHIISGNPNVNTSSISETTLARMSGLLGYLAALQPLEEFKGFAETMFTFLCHAIFYSSTSTS